MLRSLLLVAALLAPAAAAATSAWAQDLPPASSAPATSSPPSVSGDAAGPGRYGRKNMSPELRRARQAMVQACSADFAKFCADASGGQGEGQSQSQSQGQGAALGRGGARMQCLRQHASEVSDGCRGSMQVVRAARQGAAPASPQG